MEIKRLVSKYVYRVEPNPGGGFIARATDPNVPPLDAGTREELQQKIQSAVLAGLSTDFPGLKLPPQSSGRQFSFHVERRPDGTFDIHSSDPGSMAISASSHDEVESHFAERLISFVGRHMLPGASDTLRAQLTSGDINVFVKTSGFTLTTTNDADANGGLIAANASSRAVGTQAASNPETVPGLILSNSSSQPTFGSTNTPIDSSPITPGTDSAKFFRIMLVLLALVAVAYFFLRHR